ncbi:MAG: hypothetical protein KAH86_08310 [Methanosarcinales archaeon]|nr:hypothetical protein [Methanosarcinales archaeon]
MYKPIYSANMSGKEVEAGKVVAGALIGGFVSRTIDIVLEIPSLWNILTLSIVTILLYSVVRLFLKCQYVDDGINEERMMVAGAGIGGFVSTSFYVYSEIPSLSNFAKLAIVIILLYIVVYWVLKRSKK